MKKLKVPKSLLSSVEAVEGMLSRYETLERYVLQRVLEAGRSDVSVDEVFIKAARSALNSKPRQVLQLPARAREHAVAHYTMQ